MPSGKTHDRITLLVLAPTFAASWLLTRNLLLATIVTATTAFSGFMFGPDLDIQSSQYTRWGVFRFLWLPYKVIFAHRSRWSHGILFGTIIRVLYFSGIVALLIAFAIYLRAFLIQQTLPTLAEVFHHSQIIRHQLFIGADANILWSSFIGLWWGAATHTLTDVVGSMLRKSKEIW